MIIRLATTACLLVAAGTLTGPAQAQDAGNGGKLFNRYCSMCHYDPGQDKSWRGPSLYKILGDNPCDRSTFFCSPALKNAKIVWTEQTLDQWLRSPQGMVPGSKMFITGLSNPQERADIIAYFKGF